MTTTTEITTAFSKSAIVAATEERSGVMVGEALTRRNTQVAVYLGIAMASRQLKIDFGVSVPSYYHSNLNNPADAHSFSHVVSLRNGINIGIERMWSGKVNVFVSSTNPSSINGNCIWHVAEAQVDYSKVNTVEKAARLIQRLIVAAATPGAKLLAA